MVQPLTALGRLREHRARMLRFALVGVANTAIDAGLFNYLYYLRDWPLLWANSAGYAAGLTNSYLCNHFWTFRRPRAQFAVRPAALFVLINLIGLMLANATIALLARVLAPWLAKLGAIGVTFAWNYWASQRYVFREHQSAAPAPDPRG
jgi:putative flippase GtrA